MQEGMDVKHQLIPEKIRLAIKVSLTETGVVLLSPIISLPGRVNQWPPLVRVKLYNSIHPSNYRNTSTPSCVSS